MNREQLVEKAAEAIKWEPSVYYPGAVQLRLTESDDEIREMAVAVVDALLPEVSTVEELEALPPRTLLLVITESGQPATPWWDDDGRGGPVRLWTHDGYAADAEAILDMYPMTVVWSPS